VTEEEIERRLTQDELAEKVSKAVVEALGGEFMVPVKKHYNDHQMLDTCILARDEMRANHDFVSAIRSGTTRAVKISWGIVVTGTAAFALAALWHYVKDQIKLP